MKNLSKDVQEEIKLILKSYNKANVTFKDEKYFIVAGTLLKLENYEGSVFIGTCYAKDFYSFSERIINFFKNPIESNGGMRKNGKRFIISKECTVRITEGGI